MAVQRNLIETSDGVFDTFVEPNHLPAGLVAKNRNIVSLFLSSWLTLLADSPLEKKPKVVFYRFRKLFSGDLVELISSYADKAQYLMNCSEVSELGTKTSFSLSLFKDTPVFREYLEWYRSGDPVLLRYLLSFLSFGKKLSYEDDEMNTVAFRNWMDVEVRMHNLVLPSDLTDLSKVVEAIVPSLTSTPYTPTFGSGRVSEQGVSSVHDKWTELGTSGRLRYYATSYTLTRGLDPFSFIPAREDTVNGRLSLARLKFVPKDIRKSRSICMEPNSHMYFQQLVRVGFEDAMHNNLLKGFVNIKDQTRNQRLAGLGSLTNRLDTIDLSSASDSVHIDLVKRLFPRKVLFHLLGTRSSRTLLPDGSTYMQKKFAPMGSALCFPVQTTIFSACVIYAYMIYHVTDGMSCMPKRDELSGFLSEPRKFLDNHVSKHDVHSPTKYAPFTVYGDDIICDSRITAIVTSLLTQLGFMVNLPKSFRGTKVFRESCGGFYYESHDVTPLLFRVKHHQTKVDPDTYGSFIGMINRAGDFGYRRLQSQLINHLRSLVKKSHGHDPLPFTMNREDTSKIFTKDVRVSNFKSRYNGDLQRDEIRVLLTETAYERDNRDIEQYLYVAYMKTVFLRKDALPPIGGRGAQRKVPIGTRFKWRWIPLE